MSRVFRQARAETRSQIANKSEEEFRSHHGDVYDGVSTDVFRASEFSGLDAHREIYLDYRYVGGSLPPLCQRYFAALESGAAENPHSAGKSP